MNRQEQKKTSVKKFISVVKKYTEMTQLDATILRKFVEQTRVSDTYTTGEQQKRVKIREIEIVYNFIGALDFEGAREQSQTRIMRKSVRLTLRRPSLKMFSYVTALWRGIFRV